MKFKDNLKLLHTRCSRVITDFLLYLKFRKNLNKLIKNLKRFCDLCNTTNVQGLRIFQNFLKNAYIEMWTEYSNLIVKIEHNVSLENQDFKFLVVHIGLVQKISTNISYWKTNKFPWFLIGKHPYLYFLSNNGVHFKLLASKALHIGCNAKITKPLHILYAHFIKLFLNFR